jgi:hypothetical protein
MSKARASVRIGIFPSLTEGKGRDHVFYCDGSLKVLVVAELLCCQLSTLAAVISQLYLKGV